MGNNFAISSRKCLDLTAYIQVEEVKDEKGQVVFRFVRFNLDQNVIDRILQARTKGKDLCISPKRLGELRSYALLDAENRLQSGLTFCTYYYHVTREKVADNIVMRSVISLDGDIIHQIRHDCLVDSTWCLAIATAHHWLVAQLLNNLHLKTALLLKWISWGLSLLVVLPTVIVYIQQLNLLNLLVSLLTSWLLQIGFKRLLYLFFPLLNRWLLRQLLLRLLSSNLMEKKIAKGILEWFGV
ncbi:MULTISPECIES: hypothetical protein [Cyanophyceae]|uniref:hypothetical protein n=1 Tax=Cyanophyceae TaxID=3028117 RepID=UPI001685ED7E|nr:hypothetical protein [Trichocoleus sp. FACHB-40]MBD2002413.1 hypothetical protein [Trichocoleus sp. FACHB-40]